jgi:hypothetical protein
MKNIAQFAGGSRYKKKWEKKREKIKGTILHFSSDLLLYQYILLLHDECIYALF